MAEIEAVVFDWDGTLMDSKKTLIASYHEATMEVLGYEFPTDPADIEEIVQLRASESFEIVTRDSPEKFDEFAEVFHRVYTANAQRNEPFPGTLETLAELRRRGVKVGVATSKARKRMVVEGERTGISPLLDAAITGDDVTHAKPHPEAVVEAIKALGVAPERALYVGDGPNDIKAGRDAGALTVGVTFGFHPDEMRDEKPDHVIERTPELLDLL